MNKREFCQLRSRHGRIYLDYVTIDGASYRELAEKYNLSHQRIAQVVQRVNNQLDERFGIGDFRQWREDQNKRQKVALRKLVNQWVRE